MKFNCGPSSHERYLARVKREEDYRRDTSDWHDCFCWAPVRVAKGDCRWLEKVQRRFWWSHSIYDNRWFIFKTDYRVDKTA